MAAISSATDWVGVGGGALVAVGAGVFVGRGLGQRTGGRYGRRRRCCDRERFRRHRHRGAGWLRRYGGVGGSFRGSRRAAAELLAARRFSTCAARYQRRHQHAEHGEQQVLCCSRADDNSSALELDTSYRRLALGRRYACRLMATLGGTIRRSGTADVGKAGVGFGYESMQCAHWEPPCGRRIWQPATAA